MREGRLEPILRFPDFEGDWEDKRLSELFSTFKSGFGITSSNIRDNDKYPVYGGNGLRGYTDTYTHDGFYFLIGRQGALCGNINKSYGKAYISEHAIACQANKYSDTEWLAQRLEHYNLNRLSESSAQPGLSVEKLLRLKIIVPKLEEQQKIASFLTSVDKRIELLTQKKEKLKHYQKAVMQKIFNLDIRFKDANGNDFPKWEEKRLGEICEITKGQQLNASELTEKGDYPCLNGGISPSGYTDNYNTEKNTITISEGGNSCGYVNFMTTKFWSGGHCYSLLGIKSYINKHFLYQYLKYVELRIMRLRVGSGLPNIQKKDIYRFNVIVPCKAEQQKIASFLSAIDKQIEAVANQIDSMKAWKKGLLQQMFV